MRHYACFSPSCQIPAGSATAVAICCLLACREEKEPLARHTLA
jgi:hypothetical protein